MTADTSILTTASTPLLPRLPAATEQGAKRLSTWQLLAATLLLCGIQFVWTVELGYGTPYLLSLGLSKPLMTLVWMAGPLSGLIIQPIVGQLSDRSQSSWGRRRPFILGGSVFVILSVLCISYARELGHLADVWLGWGDRSVLFAVGGFYVLDFSINAAQACGRALALDVAPLEQQGEVNAWAGRMLNLGGVAGYLVGFTDLARWGVGTQMQALCLVALAVFTVTTAVSCIGVQEKQADGASAAVESDWGSLARGIWRGVRQLPRPVQMVCNVQFFAWMAWFPFLFFATTWVVEVIAREEQVEDARDPAFLERATRAGSFAMFLYSVASLGLSLLLPLLVGERCGLRWWWRASLVAMAAVLGPGTWMAGSVGGATAVIVLMAFPWALAMWAPFAMVGEYVSIAAASRESQSDGVSLLEGGAILGIHNMYVVLPQFVINGVSSLVFMLIGRQSGNDLRSVEFLALQAVAAATGAVDGVGVVLRIGAGSALIAAFLTVFLYDQRQMQGFVVEQRLG
ncbi:major facilitator superfamily domain-containing protein [Kickxella alabastrina]|uniref:major facilitator superfamily domain-containing protein n=1 Tax=Kickxella alabastrina TaxID=61397 RepID=UPI00221EAA24|nr:major facilitator superfamily domain-containing protein [Kickxella alabastrina]KAI7822103.1 major facilitator superfamily domain-containing protein [Kickxella alabastrina]